MYNCELPQYIIQSELGIQDFTVTNIANGMSKRVYLIKSENYKAVLYIWKRPFETLTEAVIEGKDYLYPDGFDYFCYNTKLLQDIGIRVPSIIKTGIHSGNENFEYAYVEYFEGKSLNEYLKENKIESIADKLGSELDKLQQRSRSFYGPPSFEAAYHLPCYKLCFDFAVKELDLACKLDKEVRSLKNRILKKLDEYMDKLNVDSRPAQYCLIHGEMTPEHVWVLNDGSIGFIDIEGIKFFDIEFEYSILDIIYGYLKIRPVVLNQTKLSFYKLHHRIGWLSASVDYLCNVDGEDKLLKSFRKTQLSEIKKEV